MLGAVVREDGSTALVCVRLLRPRKTIICDVNIAWNVFQSMLAPAMQLVTLH
jgi:hypothetical protein